MNSLRPFNLSTASFPGLMLLAGFFVLSPLHAATRVKDVADVEGARDNQLIGYGIVSGLDGQGDSDKLLTQQTIANLMSRFGIQITSTNITGKNSAVVMITATIPAFARQGTKIDATVCSLADAKSLNGGVLLQTPLVGGDGQVYAVAQGSVFLGGFTAGTGGSGGASVQKNHATTGVVVGGAIIENEIPTTVFSKGVLEVVLRQGDFTSAVRLANAINEQIAPLAQAISPTTVQVFVPREMQSPEKQMEFVARIENALFVPDSEARIVINERTGTVVANANIQISKVAVAYGNLTVAVESTPEVSQPNSFSGGGAGGAKTVVTDRTSTSVKEEKKHLIVLPDSPTVEDVAFALNSMGATPRELMSILQSIKDAGALNADLELK